MIILNKQIKFQVTIFNKDNLLLYVTKFSYVIKIIAFCYLISNIPTW